MIIIFLIFIILLSLVIFITRKTLKEMEEQFIEERIELENELLNYKKLVKDVKDKIRECSGTQFYRNPELALRNVYKVIDEFEIENFEKNID